MRTDTHAIRLYNENFKQYKMYKTGSFCLPYSLYSISKRIDLQLAVQFNLQKLQLESTCSINFTQHSTHSKDSTYKLHSTNCKHSIKSTKCKHSKHCTDSTHSEHKTHFTQSKQSLEDGSMLKKRRVKCITEKLVLRKNYK